MCYVSVGVHDVVADEVDKTPVQGVYAGRRHDESGRCNQPLPQLLSRLVSNASHPSCRGRDGKCCRNDHHLRRRLAGLTFWPLLFVRLLAK